jgi:hypothetical protein
MSAPRAIQAEVPQGSVLSPTIYSAYINVTPKHQVMTLVYTPRIALRVFSKVKRGLNPLRRGASARTLKSMKIKLELPTSLILRLHPTL